MCNRYETPDVWEIERYWHVGREDGPPRWVKAVFPRSPGPFIRRARHATGYERELVVGQWGLIPWFAKTPKLTFSTNNARSEELASKPTFKDPWKRGQRCIIPASSFDEPYWGPYEEQFKKCQWWSFRRADGQPWGLAGLWNTWVDKATGEIHESYTMLTVNADEHPIMGKMHKNELDPATKKPLSLERQDKRSVIPIEPGDVDQWLIGSVEEAMQLLKLAPADAFDAGPTELVQPTLV
ncbi:Putative SOS response-associated peptidase YedK [Variovorax sp. HW608]|uniref:SOS response-associated peptidase n=1 Tax=Variovorax sp. HW608 TaxID=1034889 RepID=UPI00081FFFDF|nr:SOS response-associated peptidase family protein [Variovorax sp. HW608]SCK49312.1 Putative SOS response-associated peptidase YedK [Variovorax sp. HW608]